MPDESPWRSRIVGTGEEAPDQLLANPKNYRRHPGQQRDALRGSLDALGIIDTVIVNRVTGHIVDGHARVEEYLSAGIAAVPVTYVELTPEEEALALLALDPISALAVNDARALNDLLAEVGPQDDAGLQNLLDGLARQAATFQPNLEPGIGIGTVTDEDVARAGEHLNPDTAGRDQIRVLCPHCGEALWVDRA